MVMTHAVFGMTKTFNQLRHEGHEMHDQSLKHFSPYRTSHMNRLGVFILDNERDAEEPVFDLTD
jgi:hypothetical protein